MIQAFVITCDASYYPDGNAGWGAVFESDGRIWSECGMIADVQSSYGAELYAIVQSLKTTPVGATVIIRTDCAGIISLVNKLDSIGRKYYMRARGKVMPHYDLTKSLSHLVNNRSVSFIHTKGHAGDFQNERAHNLAKRKASQLLAAATMSERLRIASLIGDYLERNVAGPLLQSEAYDHGISILNIILPEPTNRNT